MAGLDGNIKLLSFTKDQAQKPCLQIKFHCLGEVISRTKIKQIKCNKTFRNFMQVKLKNHGRLL